MTITSTHSIDSNSQPDLLRFLSSFISAYPNIKILSYTSSSDTINPSNTLLTIQFPTLELKNILDSFIGHPPIK